MAASTGSPTPPTWPSCQAADGCRGIQVGSTGVCLAHLDESDLASWLTTLGPGSDLDLSGTQIQAKRLDRLLTAIQDEEGRPRLGAARFNEAQFAGAAQFNGTHFTEPAVFGGVEFADAARFQGSQFAGGAVFTGASFAGKAVFAQAQFTPYGSFTGAQFAEDAVFNGAHFGVPLFKWAQFAGDARFKSAQFVGEVEFEGAQFARDASFDGARFARAVVLGPLLVRGTLELAAASFEDTLAVQAVAARVRLDRATCAAGVTLQLRYAEITLDGVRLAQPIMLAAADRATVTWPTPSGPATVEPPGRPPTPRLLSVRATDVANLVITDLSLVSCLFAGAHHLDQLRLEGAVSFAQPPRGLWLGWAWPPVWWWTRRQTLAEEHAWRATRSKGAGWQAPDIQPPAWLTETTGQRPRVIGPERLAGLYRALRKAREDSKDEPGAADFYYGEMEMRRLASTTPWGEQVILTLYWLVAGYGLRGLRALTALAVVVLALAGLFHALGFVPARPPPSWWDSLLYTAGSTLSISDDALKLTAWGKLLRIVLRVLGPLLLGLALLSVRNRVKR